jgi:hypothetical protein
MKRGVPLTPTASHLHDSTAHSTSVWPRPGKEPLVDVDRAVFVAIHYQAAVRTAIRAYPKWHALLVLADMAHPGRIALIYDKEFFPKTQTLVGEHLHKARDSPIIVHHTVTYLPLPPLFGDLALLFLDDHLLLGKIADHHSPFSQSVCDEMGGFVQTVSLFVAFLLGNPLVDLGEMNVPAGFLLAFVPFGANLVQLLVVVAVALEAADVVEAPLIGIARRQGLDAQVKGDNTLSPQGALLAFLPSLACLVLIVFAQLRIVIDKRAIIVPARIPGDGHFVKMLRGFFCQVRYDILVAFRPPVATATCGEDDRLALHFQVHRWIAERKELMTRLETGEPWLFSCCQATEEPLHGFVEPEVDLGQELAVDGAQLRVILLALAQGLLGLLEVPAFAAPQLHHPPVVQPATLGLHELQSFGVLLADLDFDLLTK